MAIFNVNAYQEMFVNEPIEADSAEEAEERFIEMLKVGKIVWQISDEDVEIAEVVPADETE